MRIIVYSISLCILAAVVLMLSLSRILSNEEPASTEAPIVSAATEEANPVSSGSPAPMLPIEIIDGEIWVAIEVEGMPDV